MSVILSAADPRNAERFPGNFMPPTKLGIKPTPIYVYNIAKRSFTRKLPPNHPMLFFAECPKDERYMLVHTLTHPYLQPEFDQQNNPTATYQSGYREAVVMLNPNNPSSGENWRDQDFEQSSSANVGGNLNKLGLFFSVNNPPKYEEVSAAYARLEKTYRAELERMSKAKTSEEAMSMRNSTSIAAAEYFKKSFSWYQSDLNAAADPDKVNCGACDELIRPNAKLCIHCGAPTDPDKLEAWLDRRFKPQIGRPPNEK